MTLLRYLGLPFRLAPQLLILIFAVLLRLCAHAGILGVPLALILCSWFFKYAFMLLDHAAHGRADAPVLTPEAANPVGEMRPLLYLLAIGAFYALTGIAGDLLGSAAATVLREAGLLLLPAIIATHAITGSFFQAINPVIAFEMVRRLGPAYGFVVVVTLLCGLLARWAALDAVEAALVVRLALLMQLVLMCFAVLGGAIYERRFELGFEPDVSPEKQATRERREQDRERDHFADLLFHEYRSGAIANPLKLIGQRVAASAAPLDEYAWIFERVGRWTNPRLANRVAQDYLPLLLARQQNGAALDVVKARVTADPDFRPATSEQLIKLALLARAAGELSVARALLKDFDQRYPNDPARGSAARLAAMLER